MEKHEEIWLLLKKHPKLNISQIASLYNISTFEISQAQHLKMKHFIPINNKPELRIYTRAFHGMEMK